MLPKLGRLPPGEAPGLEAIDGGLTLGREMEGPSMLGLLLMPSEGRETEEPWPGRDVGRLLTLGSEGRLDGIEMLGRGLLPPLGRETLALGRDAPPLGRETLALGREALPLGRDPLPPDRPPPPTPIDGLELPALPRPPPPDLCPQAAGANAKLDAPASRIQKAIGLMRRIMVLTGLSLECDDLSPLLSVCFFGCREMSQKDKGKRRRVAALQSRRTRRCADHLLGAGGRRTMVTS